MVKVPETLEPYTSEEVKGLRAVRLINVAEKRAELVRLVDGKKIDQ